MFYPNYLIHFNKNHSSSSGQFISGDGDGDGVVDDHHNYKKNKVTDPKGDWGFHDSRDRKYRKKLIKMGKQRQKYDEEFENSEFGKKARENLSKIVKEYQDLERKSQNKQQVWDDERGWVFKDKKFDSKITKAGSAAQTAEMDYFSTKGKYVCNKLLEKNSAYDVSSYGIGWDLPVKYKDSVNELIDNYGEQYYWSYNDAWDF